MTKAMCNWLTMPLDNSRTWLSREIVGIGEKMLGLGTVEARMHPADVIEQLRNLDPARQHSDIGNEGDVAHQPVALCPGIVSQHLQFAFIGGEAENGVERGCLARTVAPDNSQDASLFDAEIDAVQGDGRAE